MCAVLFAICDDFALVKLCSRLFGFDWLAFDWLVLCRFRLAKKELLFRSVALWRSRGSTLKTAPSAPSLLAGLADDSSLQMARNI